MSERPILHDYSRGSHRSGWGIISFEFLSAGTVKIAAFGLKEPELGQHGGWGKLLVGEEAVISMPDGDVLYEILEIDYVGNPYDMYWAELKYIQHLTGFRIAGQNNPEQHARQIEWGTKRRMDSRSAEEKL